MRSSLLLVVSALLPAVCLAPAEAQEPPTSRFDGLYVGVFGGWSHRKDIAVEESRPLFDFTASVDVEDGFLAGLTLGIRPSAWLRAEAEHEDREAERGHGAEAGTADARTEEDARQNDRELDPDHDLTRGAPRRAARA